MHINPDSSMDADRVFSFNMGGEGSMQ